MHRAVIDLYEKVTALQDTYILINDNKEKFIQLFISEIPGQEETKEHEVSEELPDPHNITTHITKNTITRYNQAIVDLAKLCTTARTPRQDKKTNIVEYTLKTHEMLTSHIANQIKIQYQQQVLAVNSYRFVIICSIALSIFTYFFVPYFLICGILCGALVLHSHKMYTYKLCSYIMHQFNRHLNKLSLIVAGAILLTIAASFNQFCAILAGFAIQIPLLQSKIALNYCLSYVVTFSEQLLLLISNSNHVINLNRIMYFTLSIISGGALEAIMRNKASRTPITTYVPQLLLQPWLFFHQKSIHHHKLNQVVKLLLHLLSPVIFYFTRFKSLDNDHALKELKLPGKFSAQINKFTIEIKEIIKLKSRAIHYKDHNNHIYLKTVIDFILSPDRIYQNHQLLHLFNENNGNAPLSKQKINQEDILQELSKTINKELIEPILTEILKQTIVLYHQRLNDIFKDRNQVTNQKLETLNDFDSLKAYEKELQQQVSTKTKQLIQDRHIQLIRNIKYVISTLLLSGMIFGITTLCPIATPYLAFYLYGTLITHLGLEIFSFAIKLSKLLINATRIITSCFRNFFRSTRKIKYIAAPATIVALSCLIYYLNPSFLASLILLPEFLATTALNCLNALLYLHYRCLDLETAAKNIMTIRAELLTKVAFICGALLELILRIVNRQIFKILPTTLDTLPQKLTNTAEVIGKCFNLSNENNTFIYAYHALNKKSSSTDSSQRLSTNNHRL